MERLQNGDRFYYLTRTAGLNLLVQLEGNSFAEMIMRNTNATNLPADVFSRPDYHFDLQFQNPAGPIVDDANTPYDERELLVRMPDGTVRYSGGAHVAMHGFPCFVELLEELADHLAQRGSVADADGENAKVILQSRLPLMSPAWSPDGEWLAYVSFETRTAAIYLQKVRTAERRRVSGRAGVNNAPSRSPDGRKLALTLSSAGGNLEVHVLELESGELTRITDHPAIDTEPAWSPDGGQLYFTSDRAGGPQVYRVDIAAGAGAGASVRAQRVTYVGAYNARPRVSPDGRLLAFITREDGAYRVAVQDLGNGTVRVLSKGSQDESPGFSPDGGTLIHAARVRGQGVLATVSADGLIQQSLKADRGEVREPAWGPFLP
jgi:Tol biopolymer transport system component